MKALKCLLLIASVYISFAAPAASAQFACVRAENPVEIEGSITGSDLAQLGRITRDGSASTCTGDNAVLEHSNILRRDTHNFVNPYNETVCVRVEMDFTGCAGSQTQSVAYSNFIPTAPASNVIGDSGFSTIGKGSYSFSVGPNASFSVGVNELEPSTGCPLYKLKVTYLRNCRQAGTDLTNDGRADITVYRAGDPTSTWYSLDSETGEPVIRGFGTVGDLPTGGSDYTGDGRSDLSVYRHISRVWYYATNPDAPATNYNSTPWGVAGDKPIPGDFDADGQNDVAIFRPSEGTFYILRSSDGVLQSHRWGASTDTPVSGDFDGDTATDIAIVRNVGGQKQWWLLKSNFRYGFDDVHNWGLNTDVLTPADYDGDGITDIGVWRPSEGMFYVRRSSDFQMHAFRWGVNGDVPQPADYDGDMKQDFAVYRPSNGTWYIHNSDTGTSRTVNWGLQFDQPMSTAYRIPAPQQIAQTLTSE
ncbi:MAG TPA: VCBS repeat-containing protein [Pyrinomonadaceae bacterium]